MSQFGSWKNFSATLLALTLYLDCVDSLSDGYPFVIAKTDVSKAFDTVPKDVLLNDLAFLGDGPEILSLLSNVFVGRSDIGNGSDLMLFL